MALRTWCGNLLIKRGRKMARGDGRELAVDLSDHSIGVKMVSPNKESQAWDPDLYHRGNVFINGYANPIKPIVNRHKALEEPDEVGVATGEGGMATDGGEDIHVEMMSSKRYGDYMKQDLISQLLNPKEQWRLLFYGILGLGVLQFMVMAVIVWATGGF